MGGKRGKGKRKQRVLILASGSVATVKVAELAANLAEAGEFEVRIVLSPAARHFWARAEEYAPEVWARFQKVLGTERTVLHLFPLSYAL